MNQNIKKDAKYISKDPVIRYSLRTDRHPRQVILKEGPAAELPVLAETAMLSEPVRTEVTAKRSKPKKAITFGRAMRQMGVTFLVLALVMGITLAVYVNLEKESAYAITSAAGDTICYVAGKENAEKVIQEVYDTFTPEGSTVKAVSSKGTLKVERAASTDESEVKSRPDAVSYIVKSCEDEEKTDLSLTIAAIKTDTESFTPEIEYKQDTSMFAGESRIENEGKDGEKKVTKVVTVTNGEIVKEDILEVQVTDEGEPEVIYKGTLGLPDGEDWQTYEGDPVFNSAEDLITTAKKYLGAPYKYGGKSLTNGIDCVQYVRQIFAMYGISIPNKHSDIHKVGKGVSLSNIQPGDIVCYTHHVAIYIGNGKVINATRKKGVAISNLHMNKKLITIRRVVH